MTCTCGEIAMFHLKVGGPGDQRVLVIALAWCRQEAIIMQSIKGRGVDEDNIAISYDWF